MVNNTLNNGSLFFFGVVIMALSINYFASSNYAKSQDETIGFLENDIYFSYANLYSHLQNKQANKLMIVDIRPSERFEAGHIPGSINIPAERILERKNIKKIKKNKGDVVFYADHEADAVSALYILHAKTGLSNLKVLGGNFSSIQKHVIEQFNSSFSQFKEDKARFDYPRFMQVSPAGERDVKQGSMPTIQQKVEIQTVQGGC